MRTLAAAVFVAALAVPATALNDLYLYSGTLSGTIQLKVKGSKTRKVDVSGPSTGLSLYGNELRWTFNGGVATLSGPMKATKKTGTFVITKPADMDVQILASQVQSLVGRYAGTPLAISKSTITGTHKASSDFVSVESKITISAKGVTSAEQADLKARVKMKLAYSGRASM
jgi:hypothetical protein